MTSPFTYTARIRLRDTDAAGVVFFARQFDLIHDAFEEFMDSRGVGLPYILNDAPYTLVVVHAECDYKASLRIGDAVTMEVRVEEVGAKSFTMGYSLTKDDGVTAGLGRSVHVTLDKSTRQAIAIPATLRDTLDADYRQR